MILNGDGSITATMDACPMCGQPHVLHFYAAPEPIRASSGTWTHVGVCPTTSALIGATLRPPPEGTWVLCRGGELDGDRLPIEVCGGLCNHAGGVYELVEPDHDAPYYQWRDIIQENDDG